MRKVPITWARSIAERVGADAVVVLTFGDGQLGGTSYGETKGKCRIVGKWMGGLIDAMEDGRVPVPDIQGPDLTRFTPATPNAGE